MDYNKDMFKITNNNIIPEKGSILIAEPFLSDKYFERSVVLLVEHNNNQGTMGFVLNKKMPEKMNDFFPELKVVDDIPIFRGGPVGLDKLYFIHTLGSIIPDSYEVINGVYFGGDFDVVKSYIEKGNPVEGKIKFFLGYSGWEQEQLNNEITIHSWLVGKTEETKVMKSEGELFWKKSLGDLGGQYKSWANFPKRPFLN